MPGVARQNDIVHGTCKVDAPDHPREFTGRWLTCSDTCFADDIGVVRIGDIGETDCGHHFTAVSGSDTEFADTIGVHRVGDTVDVESGNGDGVTITGSDTVTADN